MLHTWRYIVLQPVACTSTFSVSYMAVKCSMLTLQMHFVWWVRNGSQGVIRRRYEYRFQSFSATAVLGDKYGILPVTPFDIQSTYSQKNLPIFPGKWGRTCRVRSKYNTGNSLLRNCSNCLELHKRTVWGLGCMFLSQEHPIQFRKSECRYK